ncbi:MAG: hypothetical protein IKE18_02165 [Oscillospiraceae bacterium]|nr:hypothetical protein [Oscillospiraceae bacterium]
MNKKERFLNVLANKPVDYVPVAFFHHFCSQKEWFMGMKDPAAFEKNIEGHRIARKKFDPDVVKVMNDSLMIMPVDMSFVENAADLRKLEPPRKGSAFFNKTKELTERVLDIYSDSEAPKFVTGFSPIMIMRLGVNEALSAFGKPRTLELLEEDPDSFVEGLRIIGESIKELNEMLVKECGAEGIYFSVNNQSHFIPDDLYAKYVSPSEKEVIAHANTLSDINLLHICGYAGKANNLQLFKDYEVPGINWAVHAEGVSLSEGKKLFGGRCVFGGFEQATVIYTGTREEIEQFTFKILDDAGQVGVMIGADCTVPTDIDDTRLDWVREACKKYAATH